MLHVRSTTGSRVAHSALERPCVGEVTSTAGTQGPTYGVDVSGWILGRHEQPVGLELFQDEIRIAAVPISIERSDVGTAYPDAAHVGTTGFSASINTLPLPREFEIRIRAVF